MITFKIDEQTQSDFPHYWENIVGSCHAYTALRADYQEQLTKVHEELGFKYVRFHGLFDDDMSICVENKTWDGQSLGITYNFVNLDKIIDFLLSIQMKPFFELGFMPECLASGTKTVFHYKGNITMPKHDSQWMDLVENFAHHLIDRYGIDEVSQWFFEVWNEPNLPIFFDGTQEDYFHLYEITARTLKDVDQSLMVGGPATSINAWIPEMIAFCENNDVPLDFVSTHHYPTDDPLWRSEMDTADFFEKNGGKPLVYERGAVHNMTLQARKEAKGYPLYYTEWNVSAMLGDQIHDEPYAAAMVSKILADNDGLVSGYSYWTFSDIFEENAQLPGAFHGGFGLQTVDGIAKPVYRAFQIFHQLGNTRLATMCNQTGQNVEMLAVQNNDDLQLVVYNHNVPDKPIKTEKVSVYLSHLAKNTKLVMQKIDDEHANARKLWEEWQSPEYLNSKQIKQLDEESELSTENILSQENVITFDMLPHSCVYINIRDYFKKD